MHQQNPEWESKLCNIQVFNILLRVVKKSKSIYGQKLSVYHIWHTQIKGWVDRYMANDKDFFLFQIFSILYFILMINFFFCCFFLFHFRYLAICYPFKHKEFVGRRVNIAIATIYILNFFIRAFVCLFQVQPLRWTRHDSIHTHVHM